jgi:N-acetylglucosamine-6-phosphate deacetylase
MTLTLPGLFDLQVNGFGGVDFNGSDLTRDRVTEALEQVRATGVTRCLPTLITSPFTRFAANVRTLTTVSDKAIAGIHMEGPYLSPADGARGAHPLEHLAPATIDDFKRRQEAARGRIVLVTLAPEVPGALAMIEHLVSTGVRVAIGHTAATPEQLRDAITAGVTLATHLGNGCPQMLPRHPNVIWELLAADEVFASVIADGHHLPPSTLKSIVRAKGPARTILVTDAMSAAGSNETRPPKLGERRRTAGRFSIGDVVCELGDDGRVSLPGTPYLAGSSLTLDRAIVNTVRHTGLPIEMVAPMASTIPASSVGMTAAGTITVDWDPATCNLSVRSVAT